MIKKMDMVNITGQMEEFTKVIGRKESKRERALFIRWVKIR